MHELLGEAADGMGNWGPIANLAATSIIALLLVWIVMFRDPAERKAHTNELAAARSEYHASLMAVVVELAEERKSREANTEKYMQMVTENRERSHEQRMEDRKVYLEATQTLLRESLSAMKEIKNGHA